MSSETYMRRAPEDYNVTRFDHPIFARPMEKHYVTKAAANATTALSMAMAIHAATNVAYGGSLPRRVPQGIQDLVQIIDDASRKLIKQCAEAAHEIDGPTRYDRPKP